MAEHNGLPVFGYRPQPDEKLAMVNANKVMEEHCLRILDQMKQMPEIDQRWLAVGRTEMEKAWMAINRAVFQPGRVALPDD